MWSRRIQDKKSICESTGEENFCTFFVYILDQDSQTPWWEEPDLNKCLLQVSRGLLTDPSHKISSGHPAQMFQYKNLKSEAKPHGCEKPQTSQTAVFIFVWFLDITWLGWLGIFTNMITVRWTQNQKGFYNCGPHSMGFLRDSYLAGLSQGHLASVVSTELNQCRPLIVIVCFMFTRSLYQTSCESLC